MNLKIIAIVLATLLISSCIDALIGSVTRFNNKADITCYSGSATPVFTDRSTGKVEYSEHGGIVLRYEINGYRYDSFGQGRGTPTSNDSIPTHLHIAYIKD